MYDVCVCACVRACAQDMRISRGDAGSVFVLVKDAGTKLVDLVDITAPTPLALPAGGQSSA